MAPQWHSENADIHDCHRYSITSDHKLRSLHAVAGKLCTNIDANFPYHNLIFFSTRTLASLITSSGIKPMWVSLLSHSTDSLKIEVMANSYSLALHTILPAASCSKSCINCSTLKPVARSLWPGTEPCWAYWVELHLVSHASCHWMFQGDFSLWAFSRQCTYWGCS